MSTKAKAQIRSLVESLDASLSELNHYMLLPDDVRACVRSRVDVNQCYLLVEKLRTALVGCDILLPDE